MFEIGLSTLSGIAQMKSCEQPNLLEDATADGTGVGSR